MKTFFLGILSVAFMSWCACSSDGGEKVEPVVVKKLGLSNETYSGQGKASMLLLRLKSTDAWKVEMDDITRKWVKVEPETGEGSDAMVNVKIWLSDNRESDSDFRKGVLTFRQTTNDTVTQEYTITQYSDYKLQQDSLVLVKIYRKLGGDNWIRPWDLKAPMSTWEGVHVSLSESLSRVTKLEFANQNNIQGEIPEEVGDLTGLQVLRFVNEKGVSGKIPGVLKKNTQLDHLYITGTNVGGLIPLELQECKKLFVLELCKNKFTGFEEGWTGDLPELAGFNMSNNLFGGSLSAKFFQGMEKLNIVILSDNNFEGKVPRNLFSKNGNLMAFEMKDNRLSGFFPEELSSSAAYKNADPEKSICPQQKGYGFEGNSCPTKIEQPKVNNY